MDMYSTEIQTNILNNDMQYQSQNRNMVSMISWQKTAKLPTPIRKYLRLIMLYGRNNYDGLEAATSNAV